MNWVLKGLYFLLSMAVMVIQLLSNGLAVINGTAGDGSDEGFYGWYEDPSGSDGDPYGWYENPSGNGEDPYGWYEDPYGGYEDPYGGYEGPYDGYEDPYSWDEDPYGSYGNSEEDEAAQTQAEEIRTRYQEMGEVLRELGFSQFTEERMESEAEEYIAILRELSLYFPEWVEYIQEPGYLSLLADEGYGSYDDNWIWHPSSDSVYSFDCEVLDTSRMYTYFLRGVLAISGEEFSLTYIEESQKEVDFYSSTGTQTLSFRYNDTPYYFRARYMGDWMDCTIIDFVNSVLEAEGNAKRLWCIGDGGQGYIVFYNTEEWAEQFNEATGLELRDSYVNYSIVQASIAHLPVRS